MLVKLVQPENALTPIVVKVELVGRVTLVKPIQCWNVLGLIDVIFGRIMLVKLLQLKNALEFMVVTPLGIVIFAKLVQL